MVGANEPNVRQNCFDNTAARVCNEFLSILEGSSILFIAFKACIPFHGELLTCPMDTSDTVGTAKL